MSGEHGGESQQSVIYQMGLKGTSYEAMLCIMFTGGSFIQTNMCIYYTYVYIYIYIYIIFFLDNAEGSKMCCHPEASAIFDLLCHRVIVLPTDNTKY